MRWLAAILTCCLVACASAPAGGDRHPELIGVCLAPDYPMLAEPLHDALDWWEERTDARFGPCEEPYVGLDAREEHAYHSMFVAGGLTTADDVEPKRLGLTIYWKSASFTGAWTLIDIPRHQPAWPIARTLAHELGHVLGLDHVDDVNYMMNTKVTCDFPVNCVLSAEELQLTRGY